MSLGWGSHSRFGRKSGKCITQLKILFSKVVTEISGETMYFCTRCRYCISEYFRPLSQEAMSTSGNAAIPLFSCTHQLSAPCAGTPVALPQGTVCMYNVHVHISFTTVEPHYNKLKGAIKSKHGHVHIHGKTSF